VIVLLLDHTAAKSKANQRRGRKLKGKRRIDPPEEINLWRRPHLLARRVHKGHTVRSFGNTQTLHGAKGGGGRCGLKEGGGPDGELSHWQRGDFTVAQSNRQICGKSVRKKASDKGTAIQRGSF